MSVQGPTYSICLDLLSFKIERISLNECLGSNSDIQITISRFLFVAAYIFLLRAYYIIKSQIVKHVRVQMRCSSGVLISPSRAGPTFAIGSSRKLKCAPWRYQRKSENPVM
ncbi:hypothetical protein AG1IA_01392 [Rhizoctonia solani AG-1 IA]|uniref:Uncharacterized protein n=1 Tax=Thanatephorus cucumeris (strain AG1-IA) TaxID=983506 RepID=L8X311_THACA|nr:hypothetical protein AG1IA_01392 [Rhizoctonia solani AG-1 IA]